MPLAPAALAQAPQPTAITAAPALASPASLPTLDVVGESRLASIAHELRCLVCQNQSIADSNAGLAVDLRNQIRAQISAGKSDGEIRDFMVARYGDFVLYRPPFKASTALLWIGPFLMLLGGIAVWWRLTRRGEATPASVGDTGNTADAASLDRLLGK